jgi:transposase
MITVEDLKLKFAVRDVAPHGQCIVVPGAEFDPDWEVFLSDQGYKCFMTDLDGKPVTLVKLKTQTKADSPKKVYHPQPVAPWQNLGNRWKPEEDAYLIQLWNKELSIDEIVSEVAKKFPSRQKGAKQRLNRLKKTGKITPRYHKRGHRPREGFGLKMKHSNEVIEFARQLSFQNGPAYSTRDIAKKIKEKFGIKVSNVTVSEWLSSKPAEPEQPVTPGTPQPVSAQKSPEEESEVTSLLKEIRDLLQEETVVFESYCPACRDRRTVEDSNVWKCCPVCGGPLIIWNVEASA